MEEAALRRLRGKLADIPARPLVDMRERTVGSRTDVSLKTDVSRSHVANLETGRRMLTRSTAEKLAPVFGLGADDLLAVQILAGLKEMSAKSADELDPRLLVGIVERLDDLLPANEFKESLLATLLELAQERIGAYQKERAAVATKSAGGRRSTRDGLGRETVKKYGIGGVR